MKTLGICIGSTSLQFVFLHTDPAVNTIEKKERLPHDGNPGDTLTRYLSGTDLIDIDRIAVTGHSFRSRLKLSSIPEPEAVELGIREEFRDRDFPEVIVSLGGETLLAYKLNAHGSIDAIYSGNKCASGTGEFFTQQIGRMNLSVEEAVKLAETGTPHKIAGRCSVFCKSDCTHALNKGEPIENITAGLCEMMSEKVRELIKDRDVKKVGLIGGGTLNNALVKNLRDLYPGLELPDAAETFEAYGTALWAARNECMEIPENISEIIKTGEPFFEYLPPLNESAGLVNYLDNNKTSLEENDTCVIGLDVGSTTTKAVILREKDKKTAASVYLKTNGNPVEAARECYQSLLEQTSHIPLNIIGLGVTGSGRQIAALHGLTDNVINEIIAHAAAAAHYDKDVDTIFEIGGQDAKYTYLTGGVPSDYAMNEACSAGTGSFLEESAKESLNTPMEKIGELAMKSRTPPDFSDQCSAFISSDIKRAGQQGIRKNDILAGLVYSVCMNYTNKVKGARPVGKKIFMQGGVCYNRAVPAAMASLMKCPITIPPEPGLMGALGVALETMRRLSAGISRRESFNLKELADRAAEKTGTFICAGGKEKCDRKCEISRFSIAGKTYAFGGICDRWYNLRVQKETNTEENDLVAVRQKLIFEKYAPKEKKDKRERLTVGLNRSFLNHSLYPLFSNFFSELGCSILFPNEIDTEGIRRTEAAFCLPAEISHGAFLSLLKMKPDFIFLPQIMQIPVPNVPTYSRACVFVQGEPYYLKTTFADDIEISGAEILSPVLRLETGYSQGTEEFIKIGKQLGFSEHETRAAYRKACKTQVAFEQEMLDTGKKALEKLDRDPDRFGVVLFGRSYNAFPEEAAMGIPQKVASRGVTIIPYDMLPSADLPVHRKMFWAMGQKIMKSARFILPKKNLFGFYITNFSCGPDSFLLGFFRNLMKDKPSLTIELDQHTADAGIDTRIEAALDIIAKTRQIGAMGKDHAAGFSPARLEYGKELTVVSSKGVRCSLKDPDVEILLPNMGKIGTSFMAAVFRNAGMNARALDVPDRNVLMEGRRNTTCKECLPYILTTGAFLSYYRTKKNPDTTSLFFLPTGGGPCRLGQYGRALEELIQEKKMENCAVLTVTDENGYAGLGSRNILKAWQAIVTSDVLGEIKSTLRVCAKDVMFAMDLFDDAETTVRNYFEGRSKDSLLAVLKKISRQLSRIPLSRKMTTIPVISLIGEIYVRNDEFSRKNILDFLEGKGFAVKVAPVAEYLCYANYVVNTGLGERKFSLKEHIKMRLTEKVQQWWEKQIKKTLAQSGLYRFEMIEVNKTVEDIGHLVDKNFRGETILTIGLGLREILNHSCGIISIGPFGCMPSRMAEAVLKTEMNRRGKQKLPGWSRKMNRYPHMDSFPFLSIETDGTPFPHLTEANLEAFALQAKRIHGQMISDKTPKTKEGNDRLEADSGNIKTSSYKT